MYLGLLVFITALTISGVAIYYSVAGLVAIFAAAALPIMIMGGALEIGKLVTAVWLHRYWSRAAWWLRSYLALAVLVLMFITSMGIFGFLSKAHIEQTSASIESVENVARIETEIGRLEAIIARAEDKIVKAEESTGNLNEDIQAQIDKEQTRIDSAYDRIQPAIDEQNAIIQTQLDVLEDRVAVYEDEITALDTELQRLNGVVDSYRSELAGTSVASIEEQVQPYKDQIAQLDADLDRINTQANEYEQLIQEVELDVSAVEPIQAQIRAITESINKVEGQLASGESEQIKQAQLTIGSNADGQAGPNTRRSANTWIGLQKESISGLQADVARLRQEALDRQSAERDRLTGLVKDLRAEIPGINSRKQSLQEAIDSVRNSAITSADTAKQNIQSKIDAVLNTDIPANRAARNTAQEQITKLRQADDARINAARDTIAQLRSGADAQIAASNDLIQRLRDRIRVDGGADVDSIIDEQTARIREANSEIDTLTEEKYTIEAEYRKLEAEVGPIKYIAEFIYEDADRDVLEQAVRWVIITIIFVFDPLAVLLLIASQYTFEWHKEKRNATRKSRPVVPNTETVGSADGNQVRESTQELHVDNDAHSGTAFDDSDLHQRETVETTEGQVPDSADNKLAFLKPAAGIQEQSDKELYRMLEAADPEILDEVASILTAEEQTNLNRLKDLTIPDTELTTQEREQRKSLFPEGYDGKLVDSRPKTLEKLYKKIINDE